MTNEQPNTRAGEALKPCLHCRSDAIELFPSDSNRSPDRAMCCYCGMQGPVSAWNTRPLTQPSELGTAWQSAVEETDRLERELDLTNVDHVALWLEANAISPPLTHQLGWVACRITEAYEAQIAKLQADGEKLAGALEQLIKHTTWLESVAPPMCIDGKYMGESLSLADACQALTEWKDPKNA